MIAFRYSDTVLSGTDLNYDSAADHQKVYNCRINKPEQGDNKKDKGELLNGYSFSHVLWKKKKYFFIISADELDSSGVAFFESYYVAPFKYICDTSQVTPTYTEVIELDDNVPLSYDEDVNILPEVQLSLISRGTV